MAVHLAPLEGPDVRAQERNLREQWAKDVEQPAAAAHYQNLPKLIFLSAPYRRIHVPLLKLIRELEDENPDRTIAVLIPELLKTSLVGISSELPACLAASLRSA